MKSNHDGESEPIELIAFRALSCSTHHGTMLYDDRFN